MHPYFHRSVIVHVMLIKRSRVIVKENVKVSIMTFVKNIVVTLKRTMKRMFVKLKTVTIMALKLLT